MSKNLPGILTRGSRPNDAPPVVVGERKEPYSQARRAGNKRFPVYNMYQNSPRQSKDEDEHQAG